uniref:Opioid growth factor receptor-like 1 n=1 Tax=Lepisosteus oculatus TaxID=7918 RepID=W5NKJ7_LEPOC
MGNLMGSLRYKEPSTVEECDSTWETDSDPEELQPVDDNNMTAEDRLANSSRCGDEENLTSHQGKPEPRKNVHCVGMNQFTDARESATKLKRSYYAAKDLYKYRHSYPNYKKPRQPSEFRNLRFYLNKIPLVPDGIFVEEILNKWKGDYEKLEHNHTYIQWLFPLREQGLNFHAQELAQDEIKEFQNTREAKRRFLLAYTVMLDFFGIKLLDKNGNVARAANWQDRFQHLNESQHNYLRITRILKSLGELGFESFKPPLVKLLLEEALVEETIPNMKHSALEYFVYTIRDRKERRTLLRFAQLYYRPADQFIWGPPMKIQSKPVKGASASSPSSQSNSDKAEDNRSDKTEDRNQRIAEIQGSTDGPLSITEETPVSEEDRDSQEGKVAAENRAKQSNSCKIKPQFE